LRFRCYVPLPELTEDYDRVTLLTYLDQDPSKYFVYDLMKLAFMFCEIRSIEDYNLTEILIIDLNNITVGHAVKYTLPVLKKLELSITVSYRKYIQNSTYPEVGYPYRLGPCGKHFLTVFAIHLFVAFIFPRNFQICIRNYILIFYLNVKEIFSLKKPFLEICFHFKLPM